MRHASSLQPGTEDHPPEQQEQTTRRPRGPGTTVRIHWHPLRSGDAFDRSVATLSGRVLPDRPVVHRIPADRPVVGADPSENANGHRGRHFGPPRYVFAVLFTQETGDTVSSSASASAPFWGQTPPVALTSFAGVCVGFVLVPVTVSKQLSLILDKAQGH